MKLIAAASVLFALALAACATPCETDAAPRTDAAYVCADGARLQVTFDRAAGRAFVSEDGGASFDLPVQIAGTGFRYAEDGVVLRGRPSEVEWTSPAGETVACRAVEQPRTAELDTCPTRSALVSRPLASETPRARFTSERG